MKRVIAEMGMSEVTICYGMTRTSPVLTQTRPDDDLEPHHHHDRAVHQHLEVKVVNPATGHTVQDGANPASSAPGLQRDAGLLEHAERTTEVIDARSLDTHRRPGRNGQRRIPVDRRPHQGHGHPGWRERLSRRKSRSSSTRMRTSSMHQVVGVPGSAIRRGADGVGSCATERRRWTPTPCAPSAPDGSRTTKSRGTSRSSTRSR